MVIFKLLLWIWVITFFIDVVWYYYNPNALKDFYNKKNDLQMFSYSFYYLVIHIATLIVAPIVFYNIIIEEIKYFFTIFYYKKQLKRKINKIKDKQVKKELKKQINNIKY